MIGGGTLLSSFHSQNPEDGCGVDELLLVLLDADVVGAVVDVDVAVLRPQPHRRLLRLLQVAVVRGAASARRWGRSRGDLLGISPITLQHQWNDSRQGCMNYPLPQRR